MRSKFQSEGYLGAGGHEDTVPPKPTFLWEPRGWNTDAAAAYCWPFMSIMGPGAWCSNTDPFTPSLFPEPNCRLYIWFPPFINIFGSAVENSQQTDKHSGAIIIGSIRKYTNQPRQLGLGRDCCILLQWNGDYMFDPRCYQFEKYCPRIEQCVPLYVVVQLILIVADRNVSLIGSDERGPFFCEGFRGLGGVFGLSPFPIVVVTKRRKQE